MQKRKIPRRHACKIKHVIRPYCSCLHGGSRTACQTLNQLNSKEQRIISEDQKHSSAVARVHYQKQRLEKVAFKGS